VTVVACKVVIKPSTMPNLSCITVARGEAVCRARGIGDDVDVRRVFVFVDTHTNLGASAEGVEMITCFASPLRCAEAVLWW